MIRSPVRLSEVIDEMSTACVLTFSSATISSTFSVQGYSLSIEEPTYRNSCFFPFFGGKNRCMEVKPPCISGQRFFVARIFYSTLPVHNKKTFLKNVCTMCPFKIWMIVLKEKKIKRKEIIFKIIPQKCLHVEGK